MKSKKAENQCINPDEGFDMSEGYPNCEGESCDNVTEDTLEECDNSAQVADDIDGTDWKDKYLRLSAEFDNYRKRTLKEKMDLIATGGEDVIKVILPVMDDMDRALDAMQKATDMDAVREGIVLISQKLTDAMRSKGVNEIEAVGKELDTDLHEAVAKIPVDDAAKGKIVDVVQKGYTLKEKVVRYAKVVVGE